MVEFKLRLPDKQNVVWMPKEIVESLGRKLKIAPDSLAAVLYPDEADLGEVVKSLRIIIQDLELRASPTTRKSSLPREDAPCRFSGETSKRTHERVGRGGRRSTAAKGSPAPSLSGCQPSRSHSQVSSEEVTRDGR